MNDGDTIAAIADLRARVNALEKLPDRVSGLEKTMWGWGGALASLGFILGLLSDWIKERLGGG